jgi:exodeoxyribonuclease VII large subunit
MLLRAHFDGLVAQRPFRRPFDLIHDRSRRLDELTMHGNSAVHRMLREYEGRIATIAGKIDSLSPLAVLARGYTITQDTRTGRVIRAASDLREGQPITTLFGGGSAVSKVESIED